MRTYTVTLQPDTIKGKFHTFTVRLRSLLTGLLAAVLVVFLLILVFHSSLLPPYGMLAASQRQVLAQRHLNTALIYNLTELQADLDGVEAQLRIQLHLTDKMNLLLGVEDGQAGGFPERELDRFDRILASLDIVERRLERHGDFMELIELLPIRLPLRPPFELSSSFGMRRDPFSVGNRMEMHNGIDLVADEGSEILAAGAGRVEMAGRWQDLDAPQYGRLGIFVRISHGDSDYETIYGHCSRVLVEQGEQVQAGQPIALLGSTGRSTAPHLHFAIKRGGRFVDPKNYLLHFDMQTILAEARSGSARQD